MCTSSLCRLHRLCNLFLEAKLLISCLVIYCVATVLWQLFAKVSRAEHSNLKFNSEKRDHFREVEHEKIIVCEFKL